VVVVVVVVVVYIYTYMCVSLRDEKQYTKTAATSPLPKHRRTAAVHDKGKVRCEHKRDALAVEAEFVLGVAHEMAEINVKNAPALRECLVKDGSENMNTTNWLEHANASELTHTFKQNPASTTWCA
jgi:hypothetical protein